MRKKVFMVVLCCVVMVTLSACGSSEDKDAKTNDVTVESDVSAKSDDTKKATDETKKAKNPVVYEDDWIKVTFLDLYEIPGLEGTAYVQFEVKNKGDEKITVYPKDSYINDTQVTFGSGMPMEIDVGKKSKNAFFTNISYIGIESLDDIESIELKFRIVDDDYDTLEETDTFSVSL